MFHIYIPFYLWPLLGIHWVLMTAWVVLQRTDFCPTQPEERLFNAVVGVIYVFCFFSLKEGQTRWRLLFFYTIFFDTHVFIDPWIVIWIDTHVKLFGRRIVPAWHMHGRQS